MNAEQMALEIANLRAENRALRKRLPDVRDMKRLRQAHRDAKAMLLRRFSGYSISRAECMAAGIPARRWPWAVALLKCAGVYKGCDVAVDDFHNALGMLEREFEGMERSGAVLRLRAVVPPSAK